MIFETKVAGIPCRCQVEMYSAGSPMRITGTGFGDAEPPEPAEFNFVILDRKGYKAIWLEKKLTHEDDRRLMDEFEAFTLAYKYGQEF
jgi:hypothetical protein